DGLSLRDGIVSLVSSDVAAGPHPFGGESLTLQRYGVRQLICIDHPAAPCRAQDVYQPPGLTLSTARNEQEASTLITASGGPFYVYASRQAAPNSSTLERITTIDNTQSEP
ncbi:MAG TPA: hypothetical protein VIL97_04700, partial [Thermoanaerobaculia bacterium]